jgi:hypothetical protein
MALIICSDCGKQVSSAAATCPNCGRPNPYAYDSTPPTQTPTVVFNPRQDRFLTRNRGCLESLFWLAFISFILFLLFGCAPATIQGLRENHAGKISFDVDENYQSVYRKVLTPARNCWQSGLITAQMVVQGDLYTDTRQGNVTVALHGGAGVDTYFTVDVVALSDSKTRVTVYHAFRNQERAAQAVELWVKENSTVCRVPGPQEDL